LVSIFLGVVESVLLTSSLRFPVKGRGLYFLTIGLGLWTIGMNFYHFLSMKDLVGLEINDSDCYLKLVLDLWLRFS